MTVAPTWLIRSSTVTVPAKLVYLLLSAMYDGGPIGCSGDYLCNISEHLAASIQAVFDRGGRSGKEVTDTTAREWLEELAGVGLIEFEEDEWGEFTVHFDLYRHEVPGA